MKKLMYVLPNIFNAGLLIPVLKKLRVAISKGTNPKNNNSGNPYVGHAIASIIPEEMAKKKFFIIR